MEKLKAMSLEATRLALHELEVHQIELEMQNQELRQTQVKLDAARARYFDLYDLAPVGYVTLSESGLILEANLTVASLLGVTRGALVGQPLSLFIPLVADQNLCYLHFKRVRETGEPQKCELSMVRPDGKQLRVHLASTATQDADGAPDPGARPGRTGALSGRGSPPPRRARPAGASHRETRRSPRAEDPSPPGRRGPTLAAP